MKKNLALVLLLTALVLCASSASAFSYIHLLDTSPFLTNSGQHIPFVLLTDSAYNWSDTGKQYMPENIAHYGAARPVYMASSSMGPYTYDAVTVDQFYPNSLSGYLTFKYRGEQSNNYMYTCEQYVLSSDEYYDYGACAAELAADDARWATDGSDRAVARYLHDWLCERLTYESLHGTEMGFGEVLFHSTGLAGLTYGFGMCTAYAHAYQCLLRCAGIECFAVGGDAFNGSITGRHRWNIARLDGQWCFFDVGWDDSKRGIKYDYFAISKAQMGKDHWLDEDSEAFCNFLMNGGFDRAIANFGR